MQILLFVSGVLSLLLGFIVFANNVRSLLFQLYFGLTCTTAVWIIANGLTLHDVISLTDKSLLYVSQWITPSSLIAATLLYYFVRIFRFGRIGYLGALFGTVAIGLSSLSFTEANVYLDSHGAITLGFLYPVYVAVIITMVVAIVLALYRPGVRGDRPNPHLKMQLTYLRFGIVGTLAPAVFLGVILPLFSDWSISILSPLCALVFIGASGIAIARHHLFDVRTIVIRTTGYVLSIITILSIYATIALFVNLIFRDYLTSFVQDVVSVISIIAIAITFHPVKQFFDHMTNQLFYRDAYDTQLLLDELNAVFVRTTDLSQLLRESAKILSENFRAEFAHFVMVPRDHRPGHSIGTGDSPALRVMALDLPQLIRRGDERVIVGDELSDEVYQLRSLLGRHGVEILCNLVDSGRGEKESIGYLMLGQRLSGNQYTPGDLKVLGIITKELVIAIENTLRFEEIRHFSQTLETKVDSATKELRRSNEKLQLLDESKDEFISMASHQLRTPLTSVKGYLSMVLEGDAGELNDQQRKLLSEAFASSERMAYLIGDFLNVSRLSTGKFLLEKRPVDLAKLVNEEVDQMRTPASAKNITINFTQPENIPVMELDGGKLSQVVINMLDNAIAYSRDGSVITVELMKKSRHVVLKVHDRGIGVPKSEQHLIFSKFFRAHNARKVRPDGTGIGLFMAKKVVVAHGGTTVFESKEGEGSTFGFSLPLV